MSIIGLLTGVNPQRVVLGRDEKDAPGLVIDCTISLVPSRSINITKLPVESGGNITDNAVLGNINLAAEIVISEDPLDTSFVSSALGVLAGTAGGAIGIQRGKYGGLVNVVGSVLADKIKKFALSPDVGESRTLEKQIANRDLNDSDYPRKCYEYLFALQQDRELLKVVSRLKTYTNLLMSNISVPRTIDKGNSIQCTCNFEQVQIVESNTVKLPENVIAADAAGASSAAKQGKKAAGKATEAQKKNISYLASFADGAG